MSNYYYMRKAGMCDEEALAFLVVGAIVATPILGLLMIPLNNAVKAREEELAQIRNNMYCELVQVLSEKEIENVLEVTEIENCVFDLIENKLTVLANVDIKEKNEVILAYEYNMSNDLFDLVNQRSIFQCG